MDILRKLAARFAVLAFGALLAASAHAQTPAPLLLTAADAPAAPAGEVVAAAEAPADAILLTNVPVEYGKDAFLRRIAERTEGRREAVGLVLSGGSARAFAHIGVLRYLEEQGIVPDFIVSNSMGSIVGLLYAAGFSPDQIYDAISNTPIDRLFRVGFPLAGGVIDVEKFVGYLARIAGRPRLEELPIPVMVIMEDIATRRQVRVMEGDLVEVMQASFALPVFFTPVRFRGHVLIDGGVSNLLPLKAAFELSPVVVASTTFYNNKELDLRNPLTILSVSMDIPKTRKAVEELTAYDPLLIRVGVEEFSFMSFDRIGELSAVGYESAAEQLTGAALASVRGLVAGNTGDARLLDGRARASASIEAAQRHLGEGYLVESIRPGFNVFPELSFHGYPGEPAWLRDEVFMGARAVAAWGGLEGLIGAGANYRFGAQSFRAVAAGGLRFFVGRHFLLSGEGIAEFLEAGPPESGYTALGARLDLAAVTGFPLILGGVLETEWREGFQGAERSLLSSWLAVKAGGGPFRAEFEAGLQSEGFGPPQAFASNGLALELAPWLGVKNYLLYKNSLESGRQVSFFARDGLLLPFAGTGEILAGSGGLQLLFPRFTPSFGEVLLLKDIAVAAYGEHQWRDMDFSRWGLGLQLSFTLSLIGLSEVSVLANALWDFTGSAFLWGVYLNNK